MSDDWLEVSLGDLTASTRPICYGVLKPGPNDAGGVPLIRIQDMERDAVAEENLHHISASLDREFARSRLKGGEVLLSIQGTVGRVAICPPSLAGANISRTVALIEPDARLSAQFLRLYLQAVALKAGFDDAGSTRASLNISTIRDMRVPVPPLPVQRRIVDLMAHLDDHLEKLKAERDSARSDLMREREYLLSHGAIVDAGDAFDILLGRQRSPGRADGPSMTLYLRAANIKNGKLDLSDVKSMDFDVNERLRYSVDPGDVLVTEGSGSANAVGAAARWQGELSGPVCFQNTLLRFRARPGVSTPSFTYQWCRWAYESGAFRETATGTNILHIGATRAVKMPVRLPSVVEQDEACAILEDRELLLGDLDTEIRALGVVRSALLGDLLSGTLSIDQSYDSLLPEVA